MKCKCYSWKCNVIIAVSRECKSRSLKYNARVALGRECKTLFWKLNVRGAFSGYVRLTPGIECKCALDRKFKSRSSKGIDESLLEVEENSSS